MHRVVVVLASTLLVAACSSATADPPSVPVSGPAATPEVAPADQRAEIVRAIEVNRQARTGRYTFTSAVEAADGTGTVRRTSRIEGAFDHEAERQSVRVLLDGEDGPSPVSEFVVDGARMYVRSAMARVDGWQSAVHPDGRKGLEEELSELAVFETPEEVVAVLRHAAPLEPEGPDVLDGDATERFRTEIELADLLDLLFPDGGDDLAAIPGSFEREMVEAGTDPDQPVAAVVWLRPDGGLRRFELTWSPGVAAGGTVALRLSLDLYDYGDPITIEVPDPTDVEPGP